MQQVDQKFNAKLQAKKAHPMRKQEKAEYRAMHQQYVRDLMNTGVHDKSKKYSRQGLL